jgi:hypothetical protein
MKKVILLSLSVCLLGLMNASAFAATCSQGKSACMKTGGDEQTCEGRRQSCIATGCWNGGLVKRCGYQRK